MNPFLEGAILGLTLAVLLGPALFALIQTSIHRGFRSGALFALGILTSDITLVLLCFVGSLQILNDDYNRLFFGIISGFVLIGYGIVTSLRKVEIQKNGKNFTTKKPGWFTFILKGYFLNIANPFVWLFWMGVTVGVTSSYGEETHSAVLFFSGTLVAIFATDIVKVYIAKKIKNLLRPEKISHMNQIVGVILIIFGIILIVRTVIFQFNLI